MSLDAQGQVSADEAALAAASAALEADAVAMNAASEEVAKSKLDLLDKHNIHKVFAEAESKAVQAAEAAASAAKAAAGWTPPVAPPTKTTPSAPQGVVATSGNGNALLAWEPPEEDGGDPVTSYRVFLSPSTVLEVVTSNLSVEIPHLSNGQTYEYTVAAVNAVGLGAQSAPVSVTPVAPVVTPPTPAATFVASATSDVAATVDWANVIPVEIARDGSDSNGGGAWNTGPLTGQPNAGSFEFTLLIPGDTYNFTLTSSTGEVLKASVTLPAAPVVTPPSGELTMAEVVAMVDPLFTVKSYDIDYTAANAPAVSKDWILGAEGASPYEWPANYDQGNGYDVDTPSAVAVVPNKGLVITTTKVSATEFSSMMLSNYGIHPTATGKPTIHLRKLLRMDVSSGMWPSPWHLPDSTAPVKNNQGYAEIDGWEGGLNNFATAVNTGNVPDPNHAFVSTWHGTAEPAPSTAPWSQVYDVGFDMSKEYVISGEAIYPNEKIVFFYVDPTTQKVVIYGTCTVDPPQVPECDLLGTQVASSATNGWHTQVSGATPSPAELVIPLIAKYEYA